MISSVEIIIGDPSVPTDRLDSRGLTGEAEREFNLGQSARWIP